MRPIKFRGRSLETGEVIFSEIVDYWVTGAKIGYWVRAYGAWELRWENVDPDSIAQLVGYDKNGKEVYEGDILRDYEGEEFIAQLQGVVRCETDDKSKYADMPDHLKTVPFDFARQHTPLTLKEKSA